jgi:hypothetical protein
VFKNRLLAIQIRESMLSINTLLERTRSLVANGDCTPEEKKKYLLKVGQIMVITTCEIFQEICEEHPDLTPQEFEEVVKSYKDTRKKCDLP